jgi:hypothetical protein
MKGWKEVVEDGFEGSISGRGVILIGMLIGYLAVCRAETSVM